MVAEKERLAREVVAMRVAKELPDGGYVNLGIGIPTLVSNFIAADSVVFYHSESGVLNCGPLAEEPDQDIDLINAGGQFLQPVPGMAFFSTVDGFAMIRGGHVDVTVLGAHQVSARGDPGELDAAGARRGQYRRRYGSGRRGQTGHRGDGTYRPPEQPQNRPGMYLSHHRQGLRFPDSHRPCRNAAHPGGPAPVGNRPRLDRGRSPGTDRRPLAGFPSPERI